MKKLLCALAILSSTALLGQQYEWEDMVNPYYNATYLSDAELVNGKLYQAYDSVGYLHIAEYSPATRVWQIKASLYTSYCSNLQLEAADGQLFIMQDNNYSFFFSKYDPGTNTLSLESTFSGYYINGNWELKSGGTATELFMAWTNINDTIKLSRWNPATTSFLTYSLQTTLNPNDSVISTKHLELYVTPTDVYTGISGGLLNTLGTAPLTNIAAFHAYNSSGSNDAKILVNSSSVAGYFSLTGDGSNAPYVNFTATSYFNTYQKPVGSADINIVPGTDPGLNFVFSPTDWVTVNYAGNAYQVSNFGAVSANMLYTYRQDLTTMVFDSVGPKLQPVNVPLNTNKLFADVSDNGVHLVSSYKYGGSNTWSCKLLNKRPYIASAALSTGLCSGHKNLLYPELQLSDADGEPAKILSLSSLNGYVSNFFVQELYNVTGAVMTRGYAIYGDISSQNTDAIIVTYTDGWNTYTDTLTSFQALSPVPPLAFVDNPAHICTNEQLVNLDDLMIYTADGTYSFNGTDLPTATFDATAYPSLTSGTLVYKINVNGCYVQAQTTVILVNPGTATITTTPATCGANDGTATVTFANGTSTSYSLVWSTGEASPTISNLAPGQYTATYSDGYGCHTTAMAMVGATGVTVTPTVTPVSCYGATDGAISLNVSGMSGYSVLWSNGMSQPSISQLPAGNYEVTVNDGQCPVHISVTVPQPAEIGASFSYLAPGCQASNGQITVTGSGDGPFNYSWTSVSQTGSTLSNVPWGVYPVQVTDVHGCTHDFTAILNDNQAAVLSDSVMAADCNLANGAIDLTAVPNPANNNPVTFMWSTGDTTEDLVAINSGNYLVTTSTGPNASGFMCYSTLEIPVGIKVPQRQDICLVTVDLATTTNLVVWEKVQDFGHVSYYRIYRENGSAGDYMLIDTVQYGSESVFNDVVANPMDRSWRYKISAVNSCGMESTVSTAHKTLHLNSILLQTDGSYDIYWDEYEGLTGLEYRVNRYSDQNGWEQLSPTYPIGTTFAHDIPTGLTGVDYYVEMVPTSTCTAEKAQDFNSSRSNKDKGNFLAGNGTGASSNDLEENILNNVDVYPNPVLSTLFIVQESAQPLDVGIFSANGKQLLSANVSEPSNQLDVSSLAAGLYLIKINCGEAERVIRFVKN